VIDIGIDKSKSHVSRLIVVSAIVGNALQMRKLDAEWKRDLIRSGAEYFHATEHWNRSAKAYRGIGRGEREKLLGRLAGHVRHRFLFGASAIVDQDEYRAVASDRFRSQYGSAYGFAFQLVMTMILAELLRQERLSMVIGREYKAGEAATFSGAAEVGPEAGEVRAESDSSSGAIRP